MLVRSQAQQTKTTDARCSYQGLMGGNYELLSISASAANLRERVTLAGIERGAHERASLGHGWPPLFLRHLVPYLFLSSSPVEEMAVVTFYTFYVTF